VAARGEGELRLFRERWLGDGGEHLLRRRASLLSFQEFFSGGLKTEVTSALPLLIMVERRPS
jgi:hypothetical protein